MSKRYSRTGLCFPVSVAIWGATGYLVMEAVRAL